MGSVAVIMSVYKSDELSHLKTAVDSILDQTYSAFHLFIYRDGIVPQSTQAYLDELELIEKVTLIQSKSNQGLAHALNRLIDHVIKLNTFEYIARMDADDISLIDRFELQVNHFQNNSMIDVLGTYCHEFGASFALEKKIVPCEHEELKSFSITRCPFIHPTVMFRVRVFNHGVRYPENTSFTEDMALWFNLLENGTRFGNIPYILLNYRLNENTVLRRKGKSKALSEFKLRWTYMFKLKKVTMKSVVFIVSRLIFHILPPGIMELAYKRLR